MHWNLFLFKQEQNFRDIFSIFHESFVQFYLKNGNLILVFEKNLNKNCKCVNLCHKIKCARAMQNKVVFILAYDRIFNSYVSLCSDNLNALTECHFRHSRLVDEYER